MVSEVLKIVVVDTKIKRRKVRVNVRQESVNTTIDGKAAVVYNYYINDVLFLAGYRVAFDDFVSFIKDNRLDKVIGAEQNALEKVAETIKKVDAEEYGGEIGDIIRKYKRKNEFYAPEKVLCKNGCVFKFVDFYKYYNKNDLIKIVKLSEKRGDVVVRTGIGESYLTDIFLFTLNDFDDRGDLCYGQVAARPDAIIKWDNIKSGYIDNRKEFEDVIGGAAHIELKAAA